MAADDRLTVEFADEVLRVFAEHQQRRFWQSERGGVLFAPSVGSRDGRVRVEVATPPHPKDRAGRHWLQLDHGRVKLEIAQQFSFGRHFVGYWHTHPEREPHLSGSDIAAMKPVFGSALMDLERVLVLAVGTGSMPVPLDVGVFDRRNACLEQLLRKE